MGRLRPSVRLGGELAYAAHVVELSHRASFPAFKGQRLCLRSCSLDMQRPVGPWNACIDGDRFGVRAW